MSAFKFVPIIAIAGILCGAHWSAFDGRKVSGVIRIAGVILPTSGVDVADNGDYVAYLYGAPGAFVVRGHLSDDTDAAAVAQSIEIYRQPSGVVWDDAREMLAVTP